MNTKTNVKNNNRLRRNRRRPNNRRQRMNNNNRRKFNKPINNNTNAGRPISAVAPSLGYKTRMLNPQVTTKGNKTFVSHTEFMSDVNISAHIPFQITKYAINPGLNNIFPWGANIARLYESYKVRKFQVTYVPQSSSVKNGSIMIGADYDATDDTPTTKNQLMNYYGSVETNVWSELVFNASSSNANKFYKSKAIRSGNLTGIDLKTYDLCSLFIATEGLDQPVVGSIYVTYTFIFETPTVKGVEDIGGDVSPQTINWGGFTFENGDIFDEAPQSQTGPNFARYVTSPGGGYMDITSIDQWYLVILSGLYTTSALSSEPTLYYRNWQGASHTNLTEQVKPFFSFPTQARPVGLGGYKYEMGWIMRAGSFDINTNMASMVNFSYNLNIFPLGEGDISHVAGPTWNGNVSLLLLSSEFKFESKYNEILKRIKELENNCSDTDDSLSIDDHVNDCTT